MALIFECDHPGCSRRAPGSWVPSGRLIKPDGWWLMPGDPLVVACCQAHLSASAALSAVQTKREVSDL